MFGEIPLKGETKVIVKNNSIKLPSFSCAEEKELLCFSKRKNELRLYNDNNFKKISDKINESNLPLRKKLIILRYICGYGYEESKVKRENTIKSLKFFKDNMELILIGADDHIKILTKEEYDFYKK